MELADMVGFGLIGGPGQMSSISRQLGPLRAMRYLREPSAPIARAPRANQVGANPFAGSGNEPNYAPFTYDPAMRAQAQAAGVNPLTPEQVNPNAFLPNSGFFGRHPGIAGALEGAVYGAAATPQGNTIGENISGVMQGLLGGMQGRQQQIRRQFEAPFQSAMMLENLRDMQQKRELNDSEVKYRHAMVNVQEERNTLSAERLKMQQEQGDMRNQIAELRAEAQREHYQNGPVGKGGGGVLGEIIRGEQGPPPPDGTKEARDYWKRAEKIAGRYAYGQGYGHGAGSSQGQLDTGAKSPSDQQEHDKYQGRINGFMAKHSSDFANWKKWTGKAQPSPQEQMQYYMDNIEAPPDGFTPSARPNPSNPSTPNPKTSTPAPAASGTGSKLQGMLKDFERDKAARNVKPSQFQSSPTPGNLPPNLANFANTPTPPPFNPAAFTQTPFPR